MSQPTSTPPGDRPAKSSRWRETLVYFGLAEPAGERSAPAPGPGWMHGWERYLWRSVFVIVVGVAVALGVAALGAGSTISLLIGLAVGNVLADWLVARMPRYRRTPPTQGQR